MEGMEARSLPNQQRDAPEGQPHASIHMYSVSIVRKSGRRGGTYRARFLIHKFAIGPRLQWNQARRAPRNEESILSATCNPNEIDGDPPSSRR